MCISSDKYIKGRNLNLNIDGWVNCRDCVYFQEGDCDKSESVDGCYFGITEEEDYSAFNNPTKYEKTVIDRFRADGLEDAEIVKVLREL